MGAGGRQGNPLFNEALVAVKDKISYSRTSPSEDAKLFKQYALMPELARLLNTLVFTSSPIQASRPTGPTLRESPT